MSLFPGQGLDGENAGSASMNFLDLIGGKAQEPGTAGAPSTAGAGDGGKATVINDWLSRATGVYAAVTGAGTKSGPAPAPQQAATIKRPLVTYGVIAAVAAVVLWYVLKKR